MEVLLTVGILAFCLCGLLALFINCLFLNEANRNLTVAITHAQHVMEEIRDSDFTNLGSTITSGSWDWNEAGIASRNLVALSDESIDTDIFRNANPLGIRVTVSWSDQRGRDRQEELQTLITDY